MILFFFFIKSANRFYMQSDIGCPNRIINQQNQIVQILGTILFLAGIRANIRRISTKGKPTNTSELLPARANLQHPTAPAVAHVDFDAQTADPGADDLRASRQSF